jgi:hypothetical protein
VLYSFQIATFQDMQNRLTQASIDYITKLLNRCPMYIKLDEILLCFMEGWPLETGQFVLHGLTVNVKW